MMKRLSTIILTILTFMISSASVPATPDFAFPEKVSNDARRQLGTAMSGGNGPATVRALIDLGLAQSAIDYDNLPSVIATIDSVRRNPQVNAATNSVITLLLADVYSSIYQRQRWIYDQRQLPLTPLPADINQWSGEQFRQRITSLVDSALTSSDILQMIPLKNWDSVIQCKSGTEPCFPTLYDFAAYKSIGLIQSTTPVNALFSINWLVPYTVYRDLRFPYTTPEARRILDIYRELTTCNASRTPALIYADLQRMTFIADHLGSSDSDDGSRLLGLQRDLYNRFHDQDMAGYILLQMQGNSHSLDDKKRLYEAALQWLADPATAGADAKLRSAVEYLSRQLSAQSVALSFRPVQIAGAPVSVTVKSANAPKVTVATYRLPDSYRFGNSLSKIPLASMRRIDSRDFSFNGKGVFNDTAVFSLDLPGYGNYVIVPLLTGQKLDSRQLQTDNIVTVTDMMLTGGTFGSSFSILSLNPVTGAPVDKVKLQFMENRADRKVIASGLTDSDGKYRFDNSNSKYYSCNVWAQKGSDIGSRPLRVYDNTNSTTDKWTGASNIYTDLALYRPGDSVRFSAVAYEYLRDDHRLITDTDLKAVLYDANWQKIDSLRLRTDDWGRIEGDFMLPDEGLTGQFSLRLLNEEKIIGTTSFTVSDYKLPTYEAKVESIRRDWPAAGDVTITARAMTYSGFPVAEAAVTAAVSVSPRQWWWRSGGHSQAFYSAKATTDTDGHASFTFPADMLADAPISGGIFSARFTFTSPSGESAETTATFTQGPAGMIVQSLPLKFEIAGNKSDLPVKVTDIDGKPIDAIVSYLLKRDDKPVLSGEFPSSNPTVDWNGVPSGRYSLTLATADSTLAQSVNVPDIILFRKSDKRPPIATPIWIPTDTYSVKSGDKLSVRYGTSADKSHLWCTLWATDTILWQKWVDATAGMHSIDLRMPEGIRTATLTISTVNDFSQTVENITIKAIDIPDALTVKIESMRDRITPGDTENWTVTVTDNTGQPTEAAMIFDMYAKALDTLAPLSWRFNLQPYWGTRYQTLWQPYPDLALPWTNLATGPARYFSITYPAFQTYGMSFASSRNLRIRGTMMAKATGTDEANVVREHKTGIVVEEVFNTVHTTELALADYADSGSAPQASIEGKSESASSPTESSDEYRMPEMPSAFFRPMLTTDADGRMQFSFTAPNANTTWKLCALAFSRDLLSGSFTHEIISSKPVMVQPNLPRFLRTGDTATLLASVMNNTDSVAMITTTIELFDPVSGNVIKSTTSSDRIEAKESATVSIDITIPDGFNMTGYRIRSTSGNFTDGEQAVIPVLPSVTPVIDTMPFYMAPDSSSMSMQLPDMPEDARVTLQFCENPAWYCVTALPGLRSDDSQSALSAAAAIFSAAIAEGLMRDYPEIRDAIRTWQESDRSDSTLVSMLERNSDLKTVLLSSTPWMMDARSDTERMTRLALLFDNKEIRRTYSSAIDRLTKLSSKGGWKWISQADEPSPWITYNVLGMMGRLKQLGYLPDNRTLNDMITEAVRYIDREAAARYSKYPESDYTDYVITRIYFPYISQSAESAKVTASTVQRTLKNWKRQNTADKAISAIILNAKGYKAVSKQVLASLRQYAKHTPQRGMWWPSLDDYTGWAMGKIGATSLILDAFAAIEPNAADIDMIRQWLILQKEAKDWGTSVTTSDAIASILTTGSRWTVASKGATVTIGNDIITPSSTDKITGYFRTDISDRHPSGAILSAEKHSAGPAWGAVYCQYTGAMDKVNASGCDALSIEKTMLVERPDSSGVKWEPAAGNLRTGDRVKVQLTITATRDMDYVAIIDDRAACLEPVNQLPEAIYSEGICFYRENRDSSTRMFVTHMPKGTYLLTYELWVNNSGRYASGIASVQSQYAPQLSAHSSGTVISVAP